VVGCGVVVWVGDGNGNDCKELYGKEIKGDNRIGWGCGQRSEFKLGRMEMFSSQLVDLSFSKITYALDQVKRRIY